MRIHGTVIVGGSSHLVDWTIDGEGGITSAGGLSPSGLAVSGLVALVDAEAEEVVAEVSDNYEELTVVDLRVLLTERGEPIYGNKADLIARLRAWEASNPNGVAVVVGEATEDSGESDEVAVEGESEGDMIE